MRRDRRAAVVFLLLVSILTLAVFLSWTFLILDGLPDVVDGLPDVVDGLPDVVDGLPDVARRMSEVV